MSHNCQDKMDISVLNHWRALHQQLQMETPCTLWALENKRNNFPVLLCHEIMDKWVGSDTWSPCTRRRTHTRTVRMTEQVINEVSLSLWSHFSAFCHSRSLPLCDRAVVHAPTDSMQLLYWTTQRDYWLARHPTRVVRIPSCKWR